MSGLVGDIMTREVLVAPPEATFRDVVRLIEDHHVHALPVVDELRQVLGMVAESDLLLRAVRTEGQAMAPLRRHGRARLASLGRARLASQRLAGTTAGEIMTSPAVTIDSSQTLDQAALVLHQRHIGRLPVVAENGRLIGIVTRSDLLKVYLRSDEDLLAAVQEAIAAVDHSTSPTIWATVEDGVVVLQGSAQLLSQVIAVGALVARVPGIVHMDLKATAVNDDVHRAMGRAVARQATSRK
jgi:CBS domain-containing protein